MLMINVFLLDIFAQVLSTGIMKADDGSLMIANQQEKK